MNRKKVQLFCIPFAGGSASSFKELCSFFDTSIDVYLIEYPGHGMRLREPFSETMDDLVQDAKKQIETNRIPGIPFVLFGYSMGAEVAFDLAQFVLRKNQAIYSLLLERQSRFNLKVTIMLCLIKNILLTKLLNLEE